MANSHLRIWSQINSDAFEAALADNLRSFESAIDISDRDCRPYITCLGESHGAHLFGMSKSVLPGTGALLLRLPSDIGPDLILDPGWGSLAAAHRLRVPVTNIGIILISHCHLDHVGDLHSLLVTLSLAKRRPSLIANDTSINGDVGQPSILPDYFRKLCQSVIIAEPNRKIKLGTIEITPFNTKHRENSSVIGNSIGYVVSSLTKQRISIGFLTDGPIGELSEQQINQLRDCETLIINIGTLSTQPKAPSHSSVFDNALCLYGLVEFLDKLTSQPSRLKTLAVTHLGAELLEVRSPLMRGFLLQSGYEDLVDLLKAAMNEIANETLQKGIVIRVLREGDTLEV